MTETLTGKQVLALLAQDEPPEIEQLSVTDQKWYLANEMLDNWDIAALRTTRIKFRIKPTPKPDVVERWILKPGVHIKCGPESQPNFLVTWDGETGKLKSAEVLE